MDGQVSGLGTVHPLFSLNFFSTWILPLRVVPSTLKRKSSSSVMDGLQRRREEEDINNYLILIYIKFTQVNINFTLKE